MKKNLRIVSAAAALLAVAPVAATAIATPATTVFADGGASNKTTTVYAAKNAPFYVVKTEATSTEKATFTHVGVKEAATVGQKITVMGDPVVSKGGQVYRKTNLVSADNKPLYVLVDNVSATEPAKPSTPAKPADNGSENINAGSSSIYDADANTAVNVSAVAMNGSIPSAINGNIVYTDAKGQSHTALLHGDKTNTTVYRYRHNNGAPVLKKVSADSLVSGVPYIADFSHVTMNLGNTMANQSVTFTLPRGSYFGENSVAGAKYSNYYKLFGQPVPRTITVTADSNGVADLGSVASRFYAYEADNMQEVHFYSLTTGNVVTSGSLDLHAVSGKLSIQALFNSMSDKYVASQLVKGNYSINKIDTLVPQNDLRDQLKKQNITVDPNGYFTAPASFTVNMNAKSKINGATATLPVTVTVDNVTPTAAQETTKTVKIMHIATIYDKNGKATHEPALRAYNTVSVVSDPVSLKDEKGNDAGKFYKLAGKDQYIKVGNVDGTSRSLEHNSYVYKSTGKRRGKTILKKGSSVTTYGKSFMIAGHQMYRIGENQYVKKANL